MIVSVVSLGLLVAAFLVMRPKGDRNLTRIFWSAAAFKILAGFGVAWLYHSYYETGDMLAHFADAVTLAELARSDAAEYLRFLWSGDDRFPVWDTLRVHQSRSLFMVKVVSIGCLLSHDNFWITTCFFSAVSFFGSWYLCCSAGKCYHRLFDAAVVAFLFYPSVVFWTAGIMKEAIAFPSLLFLVAMVLKFWWNARLTWVDILFIPISFLLLWKLKYFYLGVFIPVASMAFFVSGWRRWIPRTSPAIGLIAGLIVAVVSALVVTRLHPNFDLAVVPEVLFTNYEAQVARSAPDRHIDFFDLDPSWAAVMKNIPEALFSGLFRPLPWESDGGLMTVLAVENFLLLCSSGMALIFLVRQRSSRNADLLVLATIYIIILCCFIALSTPNFGTLSRYRIGYLPFFVWVVAGSVLPHISTLTFHNRWGQNK